MIIEITQADIDKAKSFGYDDICRTCPTAIAVKRKQKKGVIVGFSFLELSNGKVYDLDIIGRKFTSQYTNHKPVEPVTFTATLRKKV